jgi:arginine decarboxylase
MESMGRTAAQQGDGVSALHIGVVAATGEGPTVLAAFDAALMAAGVSNFNLVRLSSVIPPGATVTSAPVPDPSDPEPVIDLTGPSVPQGARWGDRLYAVWAFQGAERLGEEAWAGVAWLQDPGDGRGLFVEHEGASEAQVRQELDATLTTIARARGMEHLPISSQVVGVRCDGPPVGALVIAPFRTETW